MDGLGKTERDVAKLMKQIKEVEVLLSSLPDALFHAIKINQVG